jgi:heptosyltransferase-1
MRILIVKPSSLGDVIHALPSVNLIRRQHPDAHIAWLINAELSSLLKNCPLINERIEFHRRDSGRWLPLLRRLRRERFDVVYDLQGLLRSGIFSFATGAPRRIGLSDAREGAQWFYNEVIPVQREHAIDRYLRVTGQTGPVEFPLGVTGERGNLIAVNPSARWKTKVWDKFGELIARLPAERVVVTGQTKMDLFELAQLYRRCAVLITNDTGPMHLAAAVGTPVIAIFGPTDPALTGPYGKQHVVLRSGIPCSPCMKGECFHSPRMECMQRISVEQVLAAAGPFIR